MPSGDPAATLRPCDMGAAGEAVWEALTTGRRTVAELALIAEAARVTDRLRKLDDAIAGNDDRWATLVAARDNGDELIIRIDGALQEARQQAVVLKQILAQIEIEPAEKEASPDDIDFGSLTVVRGTGTES